LIDYIIQPVLMGGLIKEVAEDKIKVHLHGRLGVITVSRKIIHYTEELVPGHEVKFYFSYFQVVRDPYDYDSAAMDSPIEMIPSLLGGKLVEVNDTAVKMEIMEQLGFITVPRRWVFTDFVLEVGQNIEFYFSSMQIVEKQITGQK
jgi:hypothetical protein